MLLEILIPKLFKKLVGYFNYMVDVDIVSNVLHVLQDDSELSFDDSLFTGHNDGDCEEVNVLQPIIRGKYALPDTKGIEEGEILSEEKSDPPETVEEGVYL